MSWFTGLPGTFGLPRLTEAFTLDWFLTGRPPHGDTCPVIRPGTDREAGPDPQADPDREALDAVARWRDDSAPEQAAAAITDCAVLLGSALSGPHIVTLWTAATCGTYRPGAGGRAWIARIVGVLTGRPTSGDTDARALDPDGRAVRLDGRALHTDGRACRVVPMPGAPAADPVIREEIAVVGPGLHDHVARSPTPPPGDVACALAACADDASAELALRLLIAIELRYAYPLTCTHYARLADLGERLHYSPFLVETLEFLTTDAY